MLRDTAKLLFADNKGLLAMDDSNPTCNKRFAQLEIPQTVEARRATSISARVFISCLPRILLSESANRS